LTEGPTLQGSAHPLASALAGALPSGARVLLLGVGSGRHIPPLLEAGFAIDVVEDDRARAEAAIARFAGEPRVRIARLSEAGDLPFDATYDGALTTHALLHGTPDRIAASLAAVTTRLRPGAPFHLTLGSRNDPRFATGIALDEATRVTTEGAEAGVPHAYFDEAGARLLLADWEILALDERSAAETAGRWAHAPGELETMVHWFARVARR
jgi:SAM-dependent methyltransferase